VSESLTSFIVPPAGVESSNIGLSSQQPQRGGLKICAKTAGIYKLQNTVNGKFYIGLSKNIQRRFIEHRTPRNLNRPSVLARAMRKYGPNAFTVEIIEECDVNLLSDREAFWINQMRPAYNMNAGGLGNRGHTVSEDVRVRLAIAARKQWDRKTDAEKAWQISHNLCGPKTPYHPSKETRAKLRAINLGKKQSAETIAKRVAKLRLIQRGNNHGNKPVAMVNPNCGTIEKVFPSVKDAARFIHRHPSTISAVLKHRRKTTGGYLWKYKKDT
jgi:group I intron endonuclease